MIHTEAKEVVLAKIKNHFEIFIVLHFFERGDFENHILKSL